jgi:hypothetical protein
MIYKRIAMVAISLGFSLTSLLIVNGVLFAPRDAIRMAHAAEDSVNYYCGSNAGGTITITCMFVSPPGSASPRIAEVITTTTQLSLTVVTQFDVQGTTITETIPPATLQAEIGTTPPQVITTGISALVLSPNSVIITGTNLPITAPQTVVTFRLTSAGQTFETEYVVNVVTQTIRYTPLMGREWGCSLVAQGIVDCAEPNDTFATATYSLTNDLTIYATEHLTDDRRDYYRFSVNAEPHTIALRRLNGSADLDLYIYDATNTLKCQSNFTGVSNETIRINGTSTCALPAGDYYVLVYAFSDPNTALSQYSLKLSKP